MSEDKIMLMLRSEQEPWLTSIHVAKIDALNLLNLRTYSRSSIQLPSVRGYAKIEAGNLEIYYKNHEVENIISLPLSDAHEVIKKALNDAMEIQNSEAARLRIWDWINEKYDGTRVLTLATGEEVTVTLLHHDHEHLAIQLRDGSTAIAEISNEIEIPAVGSVIRLKGESIGSILLVI